MTTFHLVWEAKSQELFGMPYPVRINGEEAVKIRRSVLSEVPNVLAVY